MLHDIITKGATDRSVTVRIIDSTDGTPETAVVFNTSGIDLWYRREGAARVAITEATLAALTTAHADGGFLHVSDGVYRLDLPDAAFATGANYVDFGGTVTGMVVIGGRVRLVDYSLEDGVRMGLTALPNAAAGANGGLPTGNASGQVALQDNGITAAKLATDAGTELGTAVWATTTRVLTAGTNIALAKGTGVTGFNDLSAAQVNAEADTAIADAALATAANLAAVKADTTAILTGPISANVTQVIGDPIVASSAKTTNWGGTP